MKYFLFLLIFLSALSSGAQDFEYAWVNPEDFTLKPTTPDSNANALVLREFGTAIVRVDDEHGNLYVDFEYHVRILIINKNGFNSANIVIPLRTYEDNEDELIDLKGTTINLIDGKQVPTALDNKTIFKEKKNKYVSLTKFTMPNLQEGSIIEYSYHLNLPRIFNFKTWEFQSDIPKLYSEFVASIPALYNYNVSLIGAQKLSSQNAELSTNCIRIAGVSNDCSKMTYIMKDIPALIEEEYMTAPSNFRSAITFELSDYVTIDGRKRSVTKEWKDIDEELLHDPSFGTQMKKQEVFKELMPELIKNIPNQLGKAKAIYQYIKKNIKHNNYIGIYSENTIKKALESHSGNTGDINLSLIAALSAAGLDAEALILSTRSNGVVNDLYPVISDFNYIIAKVNIEDKSYLLDASEPLMPFGLLPLPCINGKGRVINLKKPSYWYDIKASQKETTRYSVTAELTADGKIKGELRTYSYGYAAYKKRKQIAAASSVDEFVEKLDEQMPKISILKHEITGLDSVETGLTEKYEIEMEAFQDIKSDPLFFNPFFIERISKNPFNLNERIYPVDLGTQSEIRIAMSIKLPDNYALADKPAELNLALPNAGSRFVCTTALENNTLLFNELIQFNKPVFDPTEYLLLKEFYSRIIQLQKTDIILKK